MSALSRCGMREIPVRRDERGALCFVESERHVPFQIQRIFWLFDLAPGVARGGHAHRAHHQFLVAIGGGFRVVARAGGETAAYFLTPGAGGLYVPPGIWLDLDQFDSGAVCCVFTSHNYDEADYIRDWDEFAANTETRA